MISPFRLNSVEQFFTVGIAILHPGLFMSVKVWTSPSQRMQRTRLCSLRIILHDLCYLHSHTEASVSMGEYSAGTRNVVARLKSHHTANETRSVRSLVLREEPGSGAS